MKTVGGNNTRRFWEDDTSTKFEVTIKLATTDARMRPGLTTHIVINGDPHKDVLYVPRQALFLKENKRIVYVRNGSNFEPREVKIQAENESRAAIEGTWRGHGDRVDRSHGTAENGESERGLAWRRRRRSVMATVASTPHARIIRGYQQWLPDMQLGLQNLLLHRLRSLLTMLGMIFGVAAVVSMLSIGAGARQKVMALIEQMGVHNLIVEAKETTDVRRIRRSARFLRGCRSRIIG